MDFTYPCGKDAVEAVLPHRDPFVWVTRVVACEPGVSIHAQLDVDPELSLFKGHFPEHPVLPGVIIMEALAQAASFCLLVDRGAAHGYHDLVRDVLQRILKETDKPTTREA